ncbi:MAG: sodium/solute symporter [Verrucomicrobiales bacterium]|nr:sodium/solute symporter [Verrucomicrobiales bacterium]MCP5524570.1 sodium/solute symporter [Verrucomicrobiales bacterium]
MNVPIGSRLDPVDWGVIVLYLAGIIAFGVWLGRGQKDTRDYFLGSSRLPWWSVGMAIVATETSALTFIGVPAVAFGGNLGFIQVIVGYVIARVVLAIVMVPHYFRGDIYSPYQLFEGAFGPAARRTAAGFFLIAGTLAAGVRVYVTCIPVQLIFGLQESQIFWAILLFVGLSLIYTYVGGVKAVVWTDAIQFCLFVAGGLFTLWFITRELGTGWSAALATAGDAGKLDWFNSRFTLSAPFNIWMGILGGTFQVLSSHGADQLIVQRVLACGNVREGRKALILSAVIILPLMLMFLFVGVMLWVYYQANPEFPIAVPEARPGVGKNDYVFPIFIITAMPPVLRGLLIVAILSAAMSSVSAALAALASVSTMDFVKPLLRRERTETWYLRLSRQSTLIWAVLLILVALLTRQVTSVLNAAFALNGLTSGPLLGGLILAVVWRHGRALPVVVGMLTAFLAMAAIHTGLNVFWPWYTLIGCTVTLTVAAGLRRLLPAQSPAT